MEINNLEQIISIISKGDTSYAEALFKKPGGRKYLESIVLIVLSATPGLQENKEEVFMAFVKAMDKIEKRIKHQKQGEKILRQVEWEF